MTEAKEKLHVKIWVTSEVAVKVDYEDYVFLMRHKWQLLPNSTGKKFYAVRMTSCRTCKRKHKIFMHKVVMERKQRRRPTPAHHIADHLNGDSLDCRRDNLKWATSSENSKNRKPAAA